MDGQGESPVLEMASSGEKIIFVRPDLVRTQLVGSSDLAWLLQTTDPSLGVPASPFPCFSSARKGEKKKWGKHWSF